MGDLTIEVLRTALLALSPSDLASLLASIKTVTAVVAPDLGALAQVAASDALVQAKSVPAVVSKVEAGVSAEVSMIEARLRNLEASVAGSMIEARVAAVESYMETLGVWAEKSFGDVSANFQTLLNTASSSLASTEAKIEGVGSFAKSIEADVKQIATHVGFTGENVFERILGYGEAALPRPKLTIKK